MCDNHQETAGDGEVFHEHVHLRLIAEIGMEKDGGEDAKAGSKAANSRARQPTMTAAEATISTSMVGMIRSSGNP